MDIFIGRQPILDREENVVAFDCYIETVKQTDMKDLIMIAQQ
jgi:c-di-GMP-related signal transduction protein